MKNLFAPFYVGQEVVAVIDHGMGKFKKGDKVKVTSIFMGCCAWEVTVGIFDSNFSSLCTKCGKKTSFLSKQEAPFFASSFAPVTSTFQTIEYTEVLEKERPLVSSN